MPAHSHCRSCGRPLTNPVSIRSGIGPVFAGKRSAAREETGEDLFIEPVTIPWKRDALLSRADDGSAQADIPRSVIQHSPTGFEWGYGGSGPSDLALNILNAFVPPGTDNMPVVQCSKGQCSSTASQLYHLFKQDFLTAVDGSGTLIRAADIRRWINRQMEQL